MAHFYQEIGKRIGQLRREKGFSQGELADLVHMEKDMLMEFEDGKMQDFCRSYIKII